MPILILGLLALVQIVYLPGALLRRAFTLTDDDVVERTVVTFALSLVGNAVIVPALVAVHAYVRPVIIGLMVVEAVSLAIVSRGSRQPASGARWREMLSPRSFSATGALILATATVVILVRLFIENWGTVFTSNDAVASWDRWARDWSHGVWPSLSGWYPQLLPSNWSLTYVLLGRTDVKMFAKATTVLFSGAIVGLFFSLARRHGQAAFLWGAFLCGWILLHELGPAFLQIGYADVPLAFFGFLAWYAADRSREAQSSGGGLALCLSAALGAVLTKQGGVFALAAATVFAVWFIRRRDGAGARIGRRAGAVVACVTAFAAVWYAGKALQIWTGGDQSNLAELTQVLHQGRTYGERLLYAAHLLWTTRGPETTAVPAFVLALLAGSLAIRQTRAITVFLIAPFLLCWGLWFSYDLRNATAAFPLIALVGGIVLDRGIEFMMAPIRIDRAPVGPTSAGAAVAALALLAGSIWVIASGVTVASWMPAWLARLARNAWMQTAWRMYATPVAVLGALSLVEQAVRPATGDRRRLWWPMPVAGAVVVAIVLSAGSYTDAAIVADQLARERQIGAPSVDARLYATFSGDRPRAPVLTDYIFLHDLPDLGSLYVRGGCAAPCTIDRLTEVARSHPDIGYLLVNDGVFDAPTRMALDTSHAFRTIFVDSYLRLIAIDRSAIGVTVHSPVVLVAQPAPIEGLVGVVRTTVSHPNGASWIRSVVVRIEPAGAPAVGPACYFQWYRGSNTVSIANDNGIGWADEQAIGSGAVIRDSQCAVDLSQSGMAATDTALTLSFHVRMAPAFLGVHRMLVDALGDDARQSGYRQVGTWTVK